MGTLAATAHAWTVRLHGTRAVSEDVALGGVALPDGDVVAVVAGASLGGCRLQVTRLAGGVGAPRWQQDVGVVAACPLVGESEYAPPSELPVRRTTTGDIVLALPGGLVARLDGATGAEQWRRDVNPRAPFQMATIRDVALDAEDHVVVVGALDATENEDNYDGDAFVIALDGATGTERWRHTENGTLPPCPDPDDCDSDRAPSDSANAVAITASGEVIVAGTIEAATGYRRTLWSFDTAGNLLRRTDADGFANALALDDDGHAIVGGTAVGGGTVAQIDLATFGTEWDIVLVASSQLGNAYSASIDDLRILPGGDVLVAGWETNGSDRIALLARLAHAGGATQWRRELPPSIGNAIAPVVVDATTVAVVHDTILPQPNTQPQRAAVVAAFDAGTGADRWSTALSPVAGDATGVQLFTRSSGDLIVCGRFGNAGKDTAASITRVAGNDGTLVWQRLIDSEPSSDDRALGVASTSRGDAVVVGTVAAPLGDDVLVARLDRQSGTQRWRAELNGTSITNYSADAGSDVAVDHHDDVLVASVLGNGAFESDAAITKLDGTSGATLWQTALHAGSAHERDIAYNVRLDAAGNALAMVGLSSGSAPVATAVRLDGRTGVESWRRALPQFNGYARDAIAVTSGGDLVVGGTVYGIGTVSLATVRLAAGSGTPMYQALVPGGYLEGLAANATHIAVCGSRPEAPGVYRPLVALLPLSNGAVQWQRTIPLPTTVAGRASRVAFLPDGDVLVTGQDGGVAARPTFMARLRGTTGDVVWQRMLPSSGASAFTAVGYFGGLLVLPGDAAVAALPIVSPDTFLSFTTAAFQTGDGALRWIRPLEGDAVAPAFDDYGFGDYDQADALALAPTGEILAAGVTRWTATGNDATVVSTGVGGTERIVRPLDRCRRALQRARTRLTRAIGQTTRGCATACDDAPTVRAALRTTTARLRPYLARRCADDLLAQGIACDRSVDGLLGATDPTGCVVGEALAAATTR